MISRRITILLNAFILVCFFNSISTGATVSLNVQVNSDGSIPVSVTGTSTCQGTNNYLVDVYLWINDRAELCIKEDHGSASCTAVLDRGSYPGTNTFKGIASDCGGRDIQSYTLTLDNTPSVQIIYPGGGTSITGPFDIAAEGTFTPTLHSRKGTMNCGITPTGYIWNFGTGCDTINCLLSYMQVSGGIVSLPAGAYTVTCRSQAGALIASATNSFTVTDLPDGNSTGNSCPITAAIGSKANLKSGNLYHSQELSNLILSYNSLDLSWSTLGQGWTHSYNHRVIFITSTKLAVREEDGNLINFNLASGIYVPEAKSGDTSQIVKNADSTYTRTLKNGIIQIFNTVGFLTSVKDRNGNTTTLTYTSGYLSSITDSNGRITNITSTAGKITSIADPAGKVYNLAYSGNNLISISDPTGHMWSYTYDANGKMITKTDPAGYAMTYTYDSSGRLLSSTDPNGKVRTMTYNPSTTTSTLTEKDGGVWTYVYDPNLMVTTQKKDPMGNIAKYTYDSNRNLITKTDPDNSVTTYTYDSMGNTLSIKDQLGNLTTYTYNSLNLVTSITDPKGKVTQYTYDTKGNMLTMTDPAGAVTQYGYDAKGNRTSVANPNNQTATYSYDANNNLTSITEPSGAITTFTYDVMGNVLTQTDPLGNISRYAYDSLNRLITSTDPKGNVTAYAYDAKGNRTSVTDANNNLTRYAYTYDSQVSNVTNALNNGTQLAYGGTSCPSCGAGVDKLTSLTDAQGNVTSYQYDLLGRVTQETDPAGYITKYTYDAKGNLLTKTDANGNKITYTYDLANRLTGKTYLDGSITTYQYDQIGNLIYAGNQNIAYNLTYDADRRITAITDSLNRIIQYTYDAMGNRATMSAPDGKVTSYNYDANNRLYQITTDTGTFGFTYDNANRRTAQTNPNGSTVAYVYDADNWLAGITHKAPNGTVIGSFAYQYDNVGNRLTNTDMQGTHAYQYDPTYQLTQALHPLMDSEAYAYDKTGNRISETRGTNTLSYSTVTGNRIQQRGNETFTYDGNGNIITRTDPTGTTTYTYDAENRPIKAAMPNGTTSEYKQDPFGRRIEKDVTVSGTTTIKKYIYDGTNILYEFDGSNNITNRYTQSMAIDDPLALQTNGQTYYYLKDALGTVTALADGTGSIAQSYTFDAYGNIQNQTGSISQPFTFTGREYDAETGLYFYRARMYDAKLGRFLQKDPLGFGGGDVNLVRYVDSVGKPLLDVNLYRYVGNDPVNKIDPLGLYESGSGETPPTGAVSQGNGVPTSYPWSNLTVNRDGVICYAVCKAPTTLMCWGLAGGAGVGTGGPGAIIFYPCNVGTGIMCKMICPSMIEKKCPN